LVVVIVNGSKRAILGLVKIIILAAGGEWCSFVDTAAHVIGDDGQEGERQGSRRM